MATRPDLAAHRAWRAGPDFNEWFINGYLANSSTPRTWNEQVGWVYYANNTALTPAQVQASVTAYQRSGISFKDTVPAP